MRVEPYLMFDGRCEEALEFYRSAVGAEVTMLMRYRDSPETPSGECAPATPIAGDKVMHAGFRIGSTFLMASDGYARGQPVFQGVSLSLAAADPAEAGRLFDALADGGTATMPLAPTFFSPAFGMLTDRFGVAWLVVCDPAPQEPSL